MSFLKLVKNDYVLGSVEPRLRFCERQANVKGKRLRCGSWGFTGVGSFLTHKDFGLLRLATTEATDVFLFNGSI